MLGKKQLPELAEDTRKTEKIPEEMPGLDGREMPDNVEEGGQIKGMGLLPVRTEFKEQKRRSRVRGTFEPSMSRGMFAGLAGMEMEGYEIHMGHTIPAEGEELPQVCSITDIDGSDESCDGYHKGNVYGTYVHGIFDTPKVAGTIVEELARAKGIEAEHISDISAAEYKEMQYDKLAQVLRENLDMKKIYEILEAGV